MQRIFTTALLVLSVFLLAACQGVRGNGNITEESYDVSDFTQIDLSGTGDIVVTVGESESLTVRTDENLQQYIEVNVVGDTLRLSIQDGISFTNVTELTYDITVTSLTDVSISGAGTLTAQELTGDSLTIDLSGASDVDLTALDVESLTLEISGAGSADLSGTATDFSGDISGAGEIRAYDLLAETVSINISGAGSAQVHASESLTGDVSGAASVRYQGSPATVDVDTSGVASVSAAN